MFVTTVAVTPCTMFDENNDEYYDNIENYNYDEEFYGDYATSFDFVQDLKRYLPLSKQQQQEQQQPQHSQGQNTNDKQNPMMMVYKELLRQELEKSFEQELLVKSSFEQNADVSNRSTAAAASTTTAFKRNNKVTSKAA